MKRRQKKRLSCIGFAYQVSETRFRFIIHVKSKRFNNILCVRVEVYWWDILKGIYIAWERRASKYQGIRPSLSLLRKFLTSWIYNFKILAIYKSWNLLNSTKNISYEMQEIFSMFINFVLFRLVMSCNSNHIDYIY